MAKTRHVGSDLTEGPVLPLLIGFAGPLLLTNILQQLYNTVDMVVIGQYMGSVGTVGVSTGGEIATAVTFIATAFGSATQIYVAQLTGAREHKLISGALTTALVFTLLLGLAAMAGCMIFCDELLAWLNCPPEALEQARRYMIIVSAGLPFVFGYSTICGALRGRGETRRPLLFVAIAAAANIVLDILLVVVIPLEAAGTAIATVVAQFASCAAAWVYLYRRREAFGLRFDREGLRMEPRHLKVLLRLGVPMSTQTALIHVTQLICLSYINAFGLVASATNSIGNRFFRLVLVFTSSVNVGAGSMVGQSVGARKLDRVREVVFTTLKVTLTIATGMSLLSLLLPEPIFRLFTTDPEVIVFGRTFLHSCVAAYYLASFHGAFGSVITGVGYAKLNFIIGILDGVILRLGISFLLAYSLGMGAAGFFWGNALARLGPVAVSMIYYFSGHWRTRKLLSETV